MNRFDLRYTESTWLTRATCVALILGGILIASALLAANDDRAQDARDQFQVILVDDFDGRLKLNWQPVRSDPTHFSLTKNPGKLTITTQRGSIHADEKNDAFGAGIQAKNLFVIDNPLDKDANFLVTTCIVGFTPETTFQQAGLILYDDDDNYLKWGYEYNWPKEQGQTFVLVRESQGKSDFHHVDSEPGLRRFWLRLEKHGNRYEYSSSTDGKNFTMYGAKEWDGGPKKLGLLAKNGGNSAAAEIDAAFEFFELRSLPADAAAMPPNHPTGGK